MIAYFDTSSVVPLIVDEPATAVCRRLWDEAAHVISVRLLYAEARAALAQAQRLERLTAKELATAIADLEQMIAQIDHIEVTESLVRAAGSLAQARALRGYDAIHLAAALAYGDDDLVLVTGDRALADGATAQGLAVARSA